MTGRLPKMLAGVVTAVVVATVPGCTLPLTTPLHISRARPSPGPTYPASPTAPAGWFDECGVLTAAELGDGFGISSRDVRPTPYGWNLACHYDDGGTFGRRRWDVGVEYETNSTRPFVMPSPNVTVSTDEGPVRRTATAVPSLGEDAWVAVDYRKDENGTSHPSNVEVNFRREGVDIRLTYAQLRSDPSVERAVRLARHVYRRVPPNPRIRLILVSGPCAAIDLRLASEVLDDELISARQELELERHRISCEFGGRSSSLRVSLDSSSDALDSFEQHRLPEDQIPEVDKNAYRSFFHGPLESVEIKVGRQIVEVSGSTVGDDPSMAEYHRLLRSIIASLR